MDIGGHTSGRTDRRTDTLFTFQLTLSWFIENSLRESEEGFQGQSPSMRGPHVSVWGIPSFWCHARRLHRELSCPPEPSCLSKLGCLPPFFEATSLLGIKSEPHEPWLSITLKEHIHFFFNHPNPDASEVLKLCWDIIHYYSFNAMMEWKYILTNRTKRIFYTAYNSHFSSLQSLMLST